MNAIYTKAKRSIHSAFYSATSFTYLPIVLISPSIYEISSQHLNRGRVSSNCDRSFRDFYGAIPKVVSNVCSNLQPHLPPKRRYVHLLCAFSFLKHYSTAYNNTVIMRVSKKTHRKWTWTIVQKIAEMDMVCSIFPNYGFHNHCNFHLTI